MSHNVERKEKDCLNCGAMIHGRYCHICGQENVIPRETFWGLVTHFFYDITHFDSKFFTTLKDLLFKPGFLSKEFIKGRRASYLHPVRMYMFTSAIFFLIFFSLNSPGEGFKLNVDQPLTKAQRNAEIKQRQTALLKDSNNQLVISQLKLLNDSTHEVRPIDLNEDTLRIQIGGRYYHTINEYDSIQKTLSASARDNWIERKVAKKAIELNIKYRRDPGPGVKKFGETFLHKLPYLLFLSLPFFAAILKLLYIRRKQFYYADHAIFSIHHYIFSFIMLLFVFALSTLKDLTGWTILGFLIAGMFITWPVYLYLAMKKFYGQRWFKTLVKFFLLNLLGFLLLLLLFAIFFFFSIFQL